MTAAAQPNLARIPAGDFLMGAADAGADERPVHRVFVSEFFIGRFPVTNDEYARFVRATGHPAPAVRELPLIAAGGRDAAFRDLAPLRLARADSRPPAHGSHPVVLVRLRRRGGVLRVVVRDDRPRRPPADRGRMGEGGARRRSKGAAIPGATTSIRRAATILADPSVKRQRGTRPTGTYPPNAYGLCDMIGNVWEWVSDWYAPDYYGRGDVRDPRGPESGTLRIVRGGSWVNDDVSMLRCAYRHKRAAGHLRVQHRIPNRMRSLGRRFGASPMPRACR